MKNVSHEEHTHTKKKLRKMWSDKNSKNAQHTHTVHSVIVMMVVIDAIVRRLDTQVKKKRGGKNTTIANDLIVFLTQAPTFPCIIISFFVFSSLPQCLCSNFPRQTLINFFFVLLLLR